MGGAARPCSDTASCKAVEVLGSTGRINPSELLINVVIADTLKQLIGVTGVVVLLFDQGTLTI